MEYRLYLNTHHTESWWRHQMETFSALLAICAGNSPIPAQRPVTRSFDVFFDLRLNKRLSKQWWGWWSETLSRPLWRNVHTCAMHIVSIAIGRHGIWSSLVPAMACRLFGTKPLSETMLIHCQLYTIKGILWWNSNQKTIILFRKCLKKPSAKCWPFCTSFWGCWRRCLVGH